MHIAIIGIGHIGRALAPLLSARGHEVVFGSQHPDASAIDGLPCIDVAAAIRDRDVVVVAIPFGAWPAFAGRHGKALAGKVVIDTTNTNAKRDGEIVDAVKESGQGTLCFVDRLVPASRVVKAFNTMEADVLAAGGPSPQRLAYPVAGDDAAACVLVAGLVRDAGFDPVILPGATSAALFDEGTPAWNKPMSATALRALLATDETRPR